MTLIEVMWFSGMIAAGLWCGSWLGSHYGIVGWVIGFTAGVAAVIPVPNAICKLWHHFRPFRPNCRTGNCSSDDYKVPEGSDDHKVLEGSEEYTILICRCGVKYASELPYFKKNRRFMEVLDDGSMRPYMVRRGVFSSWEPDGENRDKTEESGAIEGPLDPR